MGDIEDRYLNKLSKWQLKFNVSSEEQASVRRDHYEKNAEEVRCSSSINSSRATQKIIVIISVILMKKPTNKGKSC